MLGLPKQINGKREATGLKISFKYMWRGGEIIVHIWRLKK